MKEGSASLLTPQGAVKARPLTLGGFAYGYAADVVLPPGAKVEWSFDLVDSSDRNLAARLSFGETEFWSKVRDGSFESFGAGELWGTEDARLEATCNPLRDTDEAELSAISGERSLVIDRDGYRDRFRLSRGGGETRLTFVAYGHPGVELASVGSREPSPFFRTPVVTPADCDEYAAFCAQVTEGTLQHYSVDLPRGRGGRARSPLQCRQNAVGRRRR